MSTTTTSTAAATSTSSSSANSGTAQEDSGVSLVAFITALSASLIIFGVQMALFFLLRNKLARIFKPKTFLVPERERTDPPPTTPWGLMNALLRFKDREIIKKCGLDAYFFLRYLQTLLLIFIPIAILVIPILVPLNFVGGEGRSFGTNDTDIVDSSVPTGLDTIAWGNVKPQNYQRYWAHLVLAVLVVGWVCFVCFCEMRVFIKIRQDYLTSAEHRMRASANTVMVSGIPEKWLTEDALRGLFDVFPGGIRNIWLTRDYTKLLDKIDERAKIHDMLEAAESELIRTAKKSQLKIRAAEEKKARRKLRAGHATKAEREQRNRAEDERAQRMAEGAGGISSGGQEVPQIEALQDGDDSSSSSGDSIKKSQAKTQVNRQESVRNKILGASFSKMGHGIREAGHGVRDTAKTLQHGVDSKLERTNGFEFVKSEAPTSPTSPGLALRPGSRESLQPLSEGRASDMQSSPPSQAGGHHANPSNVSSYLGSQANAPVVYGNTTRKVQDWKAVVTTEDSKWWQFWKPPSGSYPSPIPQGYEGDEFPFGEKDKKDESFWKKVRSQMPFFRVDDADIAYPPAVSSEFPGDDKEEEHAEWRKWVKESDRPTCRLARFTWTPDWLPGVPLISRKTDTIYHCRKELARLNVEIEEDQKNHSDERYPAMTSAFIQFNHQVAAHMACQCATHHLPKHMAPRMVEISPEDVIWDNMAIRWWDEWIRTFIVIAIVFGMTILWAIPVAFSSSLSQIDSLIETYSWLGFIRNNDVVYSATKAVAGVLPAAILAVLLLLVPIILNLLAKFQGSKTGSQQAEVVQIYYFFFLFVQVFLVVSIASGAIATLEDVVSNVQDIPQILAQNLPKAANYFFSYMILQALSVSSGTLLQVDVLFVWYIVARLFDDTARGKWKRQTTLPTISWGSFFPVYTNFACIALVYSIVAPLISIFAIITFTLLWVAHRYKMIYIARFKIDTGGVLYPRAINQMFTGLYFMELCLIGLFFLVRDQDDNVACAAQGIIMIVVLVLTVIYQVGLNWAFGPLMRYLPITFEDEAVLRDEAFQRALDHSMGLADEGDVGGEQETRAADVTTPTSTDRRDSEGADVELKMLGERGRQGSRLNPVRGIVQAGTWAAQGGKKIHNATLGRAKSLQTASKFRQNRRQRDLEAQRAIGDALYGGYHDEIEDLRPEERDALVREAFKHSALRARRPTVWIPRDDIGVSDDEIRHTRHLSEHIWISNEGTALDSKVRVVYGRAPPDFAEIELISL